MEQDEKKPAAETAVTILKIDFKFMIFEVAIINPGKAANARAGIRVLAGPLPGIEAVIDEPDRCDAVGYVGYFRAHTKSDT